jgi:XTP/dITP diphosphohydrolase
VDALNGAPGVYSARFSGTIADDRKNTEKLLRLMRDIPPDNRGAQFRCVMAVVFPDRDSLIIDEKCRGLITRSPAGENGFGYDPVFYYPAYHKTFAQVDMGLKNQVSHRGKAIRQVREKLQEMLS